MAISDRARDFWDRISPRERRLVVIAMIAAPITLVIWGSLAIHDGLVVRETANDKMRKALVVVEDLKVRGGAKAVTSNEDFAATLGFEPVSLDTYLTNAAQKAGFVLKGTTPHNPVTRNNFVTTSVSCQLSDLTIDQLKKFLQEVEGGTGAKVVVVTHLDIHRRDFKGKDKLDASLEVSTYSKEKPAKQEGGDGSSGSGAATGSDKKGT